MQSLSERKHKALITAIQQLEEMLNAPATKSKGAKEDIQQLEELFARYQQLMTELGECIATYHDLYKDLKTNVLAPQVRHIRHRMDQRSAEYHTLKMHLVAVRSY